MTDKKTSSPTWNAKSRTGVGNNVEDLVCQTGHDDSQYYLHSRVQSRREEQDFIALMKYGGSGAGGFFLACEDLGECSTIHSPPALFFFFFEVEINSRTLIPLFMPGSVRGDSAGSDAHVHV